MSRLNPESHWLVNGSFLLTGSFCKNYLFSVTSLWCTCVNPFVTVHPTHILVHPRVHRAHRLKSADLGITQLRLPAKRMAAARGLPRTRLCDYISNLDWPRLILESAELAEAAEQSVVFWALLRLLPAHSSPEKKWIWKWMRNSVVQHEFKKIEDRQSFSMIVGSEPIVFVYVSAITYTCIFHARIVLDLFIWCYFI